MVSPAVLSVAMRLGKAVMVAVVVLLGASAQARASETPPIHYVALGDSYTSGPGIPRQTVESGGCRRSDHNYPHLVAVALALGAGRFTDASCAGATTAHMAA